ncbi:hypothetical protein C2G38_2046162 [Gigaspora rosea]|uniref:Uncharacterized protein n=1 Tax=Gigaspora rosea TaxID=44941 RepID=A0A397UAF4_9GLOM|nr:hypothetical protein C2G38_2046162 [Gigaspora rosea]
MVEMKNIGVKFHYWQENSNWNSTPLMGDIFKQKAKTWLQLFLTPSTRKYNTHTFKKGLYRPADITPYIHVLVFYVPEFLNEHHQFGMAAFSCSGVKKKTISTDIKNDQNKEFHCGENWQAIVTNGIGFINSKYGIIFIVKIGRYERSKRPKRNGIGVKKDENKAFIYIKTQPYESARRNGIGVKNKNKR